MEGEDDGDDRRIRGDDDGRTGGQEEMDGGWRDDGEDGGMIEMEMKEDRRTEGEERNIKVERIGRQEGPVEWKT